MPRTRKQEQEDTPKKRELAIPALLECKSITEAAARLKVDPATIHRWLQDDGFAEQYRKARHRVVEVSISRLQQASAKAVETLEAIMDDDDATANARVTASRTVLEMAFKAVELEDIEARISELESMMQREKRPR